MRYDFLIAGAGLYGATLANQLTKAGKKCLIIDKRPHIAGNAYTENRNGIDVHMYGAKIFHTKHHIVWNFVNQYAVFNNYQHIVKANYKGLIFSMPINLNTLHELFLTKTPNAAREYIRCETESFQRDNIDNLEDFALSQLGPSLYKALFYGYTKKQWHREPSEVPAGIIKRIPIRFTWDNRYFDDPYQGIPIEGYTRMVEKILEGIDVDLNADFFFIPNWRSIADKLVFTGPIDQFCEYQFGPLEYLSLRFEHEELEGDYQGCSVMNYTDEKIPYTRIIEHKHFLFGNQPNTIITREYPVKWERGAEPYYPVNTDKNTELYLKYKTEVEKQPDVYMGGRLGTFSYINLDQTILLALEAAKLLI